MSIPYQNVRITTVRSIQTKVKKHERLFDLISFVNFSRILHLTVEDYLASFGTLKHDLVVVYNDLKQI